MIDTKTPASPPPAAGANARVAPGPRGRFLLGSASDLQRKGLLQFYQDAWKEYGDLVRFKWGR